MSAQRIIDALNWCKIQNAKIDFDPTGEAPVQVSIILLESDDIVDNLEGLHSHKVLSGLGDNFPDAVDRCSKALGIWTARLARDECRRVGH